MFIILSNLAFSQHPNSRLRLSAGYSPIVSKQASDYIKNGWEVNGAYQYSLNSKFYFGGNINYSRLCGKDNYDGFLSTRTPSFNLIGIGPSILYYPTKTSLFLAFGYNAQLSSFKNSTFVNNIRMELGFTVRNVSLSAGLNSFFNKGSLTCYGICLAYDLYL